MFFIGMVVCLIPVIGWIAGLFLMLVGIIMPFLGTRHWTTIKGSCPYCTLSVESSNVDQGSFTCKHCKQEIITKDGYFNTIAATQHSAMSSELSIAEPASVSELYFRIAKGGEDIGVHPKSKIDYWLSSDCLSESDYFWDENLNQWRLLACLK